MKTYYKSNCFAFLEYKTTHIFPLPSRLRTFAEANQECIDRGGHLAFVRDSEEMGLVDGVSETNPWVGLYYSQSEAGYKLTNGEDSTFDPADVSSMFQYLDEVEKAQDHCFVLLNGRNVLRAKKCEGKMKGAVCQIKSESLMSFSF